MEEQKPKVHINDIQEGVEKREEKVYIIGDKKFWADRTTKERLATHADCHGCKKEIPIKYHGVEKYCDECTIKMIREEYFAMPLVEWDGEIALCLYDGYDTYFFDSDQLLWHCEENEIDVSELLLVTCYQTSYSPVDLYEQQQEVVHENWEPDNELEKLQEQVNEYFARAKTNTWMPDKKRVSLKMADLTK